MARKKSGISVADYKAWILSRIPDFKFKPTDFSQPRRLTMAKRPNKAKEQKKAILMLTRTAREQLKGHKCAPALATMQHLLGMPGGVRRVSKLKGAFTRACFGKAAKQSAADPGYHRAVNNLRANRPSGMRAVMPPIPVPVHHFERPSHSVHTRSNHGGYSPVTYGGAAAHSPSRYDRPRGMHGLGDRKTRNLDRRISLHDALDRAHADGNDTRYEQVADELTRTGAFIRGGVPARHEIELRAQQAQRRGMHGYSSPYNVE